MHPIQMYVPPRGEVLVLVLQVPVKAVTGYQGIEKREEMKGKAIGFRMAMWQGKRHAISDIPAGRLDDLIETALAGTESAYIRLTFVKM
jgi:hypothetical protein